ncbi:MAG: phosphoribosylformylglycinamidine synthase [Candidatus Blackburnbacteria bacterium]|nr:phosphoribosylformylglycinamidine synthase [Candidatus Blackburnbacteria bacterium]
MAFRIDVVYKVHDTRADVQKKYFATIVAEKIQKVELADSYTIDAGLSPEQVVEVTHLLANPLIERAHINGYKPRGFTFAIEIGYLPGVTDNIGTTAKEAIEDRLHLKFNKGGVYSSRIFFISGRLTRHDTIKLAESLYNPLIQRVLIKSSGEFVKDSSMGVVVPRVLLETNLKIDTINLKVPPRELEKIGKEGIKNRDGTKRGPLALDLTYMRAIQAYFRKKKRNPTDVELESIAQTWSEHCKHTIFADPIDDLANGLYRTYIKAATNRIRKEKGDRDFCVSVFTDNSGAIKLDRRYLITHKVETHNSPSALDPFGGSITGIVGVNRDAIGFGLGARPAVNTYGFCFADPRDNTEFFKGPKRSEKMLPSRRIVEGVIQGVNVGGNCSGIPTPQGFVFFDKRYRGKPLVFVGTVGLIPTRVKGKLSSQKRAQPGDYVVMVGGRVGQDGIHGATFSSEALGLGSPATAVQIGDPITQKKLSDALVKEARDLGLYHSITDNGAGGLSCSVSEMAKECGGSIVYLDKVPLKYPGLDPWKIWISESQERMTLSVPKNKWEKFARLMKHRGVEASIIGEFTNSGKCKVEYAGRVVMDIEMEFLHNGLPSRPMKTATTQTYHAEPKIPKVKDCTNLFLSMLSRLNIASFEFISSQYDHEVQGSSIVKPLQGRGLVNGDVSIVKPALDSKKGVMLSQGLYPSYSDIDTYHMAASSIDTAIRNLIAAGADPDKIALLDNFCWCSSNEPQRLGQLKATAKACYDYAVSFGTPFISGKDSMFNDFKGYDKKGNPIKISIPPTLLISSIGILDNIEKAVTLDAKFPGDQVYLLGETRDELGASEYYALWGELAKKEYIGTTVPKVDAQRNKKLYRAFSRCIKMGLVASAQSLSRGGLAVALAKTAMGGMLGVDISLEGIPRGGTRDDFALFSESQGRILATVAPKNIKEFEKTLSGNAVINMGKVRRDTSIVVRGKEGDVIVKTKVQSARKAYKETFKNY